MGIGSAAATPTQLSPAVVGLAAQHLMRTPSTNLQRDQYGLVMRFAVVVGPNSLGKWQSCGGLKVEFKYKEVPVGGDYRDAAYLPDKMTYGKLTLKRAMKRPDSDDLRGWLNKVAEQWMAAAAPYPGETGSITLQDDQGDTVATWNLRNVYPIAWTGPDLTASKHDVAIETLELVHAGFLA